MAFCRVISDLYNCIDVRVVFPQQTDFNIVYMFWSDVSVEYALQIGVIIVYFTWNNFRVMNT